jgi:hypothetical protein
MDNIISKFEYIFLNNTYTNKVQVAKESDYKNAIENYIHSIPLKNIDSIYQFGSTKIPGLSDIDILVVFKDYSKENPEKYSIKKLSEFDQYLFSHNPIFIHNKGINTFSKWFPLFDLRQLYGPNTVINYLGQYGKENELYKLFFYLITKIPSDLVIYSSLNNSIYERIIVAMINSVQYTIKLWQEHTNVVFADYAEFYKAVSNLREEWFSLDEVKKKNKLLESFVMAMSISLQLLQDVSLFIEEKWIKDKRNWELLNKDWIYKTPTRELCFSKSWNKNDFIDIAINSKCKKFIYPKNMGLFLLYFSESNKEIGRFVKKNLHTFNEAPLLKSENEIWTFISLIEEYNYFHRKKFNNYLDSYFSLWRPIYPNRIINKMYKYKNNFILK